VSNFRITIRGEDVEARGYIRDYGNLEALAEAVKPYGWLVIGSIAENQDGTPVELFQEQYRQSANGGARPTIANHLARLLNLLESTADGSRLTIAHKDGEGDQSWVVAIEREGAAEVVRTAETMAAAVHEADEATR
jgi:hypothetical protein